MKPILFSWMSFVSIFLCLISGAFGGTLSWDQPAVTEYGLGETPNAAATASGYHNPNVVYTYSWSPAATPTVAGSYTIRATETVSGDFIDLTVWVNSVSSVTPFATGVMRGSGPLSLTATMAPHNMASAITWTGDCTAPAAPTLTVSAPTEVKGVKTVTATVGNPATIGHAESAQFTVVGLIFTNQAEVPADRNRLTVGVGEKTDVYTDPAWPVYWTCEHGSMSTLTLSESATFTAPGTANPCVVSARMGDLDPADTLTFEVIPPNNVGFVLWAFRHGMGSLSMGIKNTVTIYPNTVSFKNIVVKEGDCDSTKTGCFVGSTIFHDGDTEWSLTGWAGLNDNNVVNHVDVCVGTANEGLIGSWSWNIPWVYLLKDDVPEGVDPDSSTGHIFANMPQTYYASGMHSTMEKGIAPLKATKTFNSGDPNTGNPPDYVLAVP